MTPVEVGETVVVRDWNGAWVNLLVKRISESKMYGPTVEGTDVEAHQFRALPLSHKVETARVTKVKRGTWDIEWPDGKGEQYKGSFKGLQDLCRQRGTVYQEVMS